MIADTLHQIERAICADSMMETIRLVTGYHRLQASEGYRNAAQALLERFLGFGIAARIDAYPSAFGKRYLNADAFPEWNCGEAWLKLVFPHEEELCDYAKSPICVMQKSFFHLGDTPLDIVPLARGSAQEAYEDIDLEGKLVFIREDFNAYLWAVQEKGAAGFLSDYVAETPGARTREDMYDVRKYTTFWWTKPEARAPFGFVLTPRQGDSLRALCEKTERDYAAGRSNRRWPQAVCRVDARMQDGYFENVIAELPGTSGEEIWLVAHLCHPRPSANDNASGVAAVMEALRALKALIDAGVIAPLHHSLKVLLVPEFTGIYAHLSRMERFSHVRAALNLDMVGGDQMQGYGPLTLSGLSLASPGLCEDLAKLLLDELQKELAGFASYARIPTFLAAQCGFTGGSDHFILQDPTIGIPCPMLGQWPDRFYHTSGDTIERISPHLLKKSAALAAAYGYLLCAMREDELCEATAFSAAQFARRLAALVCDSSGANRARMAKRLLCFYTACAQDAFWLMPDARAADAAAQTQRKRLEAISAAYAESFLEPPCAQEEADSRIPRRTYISPVNGLKEHTRGHPALEEVLREYTLRERPLHNDAAAAEVLTQYHIDGRNSMADIAEAVAFETRGGSQGAVRAYIETLTRLGLCVLEPQ